VVIQTGSSFILARVVVCEWYLSR